MSDYRDVNLSATPLSGLDRLARHLSFHAERQSTIASNLANLDTPGYRAKDVAFKEVLSAQIPDGAKTPEQSMSWSSEEVFSDDEVPDQDGNTVSLEGQMGKMSANLIRYRSLSELMSRKVALLRYAANDANG